MKESSAAGGTLATPDTLWAIDPAGPLHGVIEVAGSKNTVTKLMVAALLGDEPSYITGAPTIGDVTITSEMIGHTGAGVSIEGSSIAVDPSTLVVPKVSLAYTGLNRIPILLIGPLLSKLGEAHVPLIGGDAIGARPVDYHVEALRAFGAEVSVEDDAVHARAAKLSPARIELAFPSVGATETVLLTASLIEGRTVLENAAIEPEVVELALFLQRMGVGIELQPDRTFIIEGKPSLHGARLRLSGDRIEAFSYLLAGLVTGGRVTVRGCRHERLVTAISVLQRMGVKFDIADDEISCWSEESLRPIAIYTSPHPGFMTDWHPPLAMLMTQIDGMSVIHETVFEDRFRYVQSVTRMGAEIELFDQCLAGPTCRFHEAASTHSCVIRGGGKLVGSHVDIADIRAGFACILAAAVASGTSYLSGVYQLERGYDHVFEKLRTLGLNAEIVE